MQPKPPTGPTATGPSVTQLLLEQQILTNKFLARMVAILEALHPELEQPDVRNVPPLAAELPPADEIDDTPSQ